jgi:HEAT repeat protein
MKSPAVEELFAQTLRDDYDADAPWAAVQELRSMGSREVFKLAAAWCNSDNPLNRARGADILAQLGRTAEHQTNNYPNESFSVIATMIRQEQESQPLESAIHALGHIGDSRGVPLVIEHRSHSVAEVRFAVAFALGSFPDHAEAVETLIRLTCDEDKDVRNWATFGLGALGLADTPEVRDALLARLNDSFDEARREAIDGLARLRDCRVLPALLFELDQSPSLDLMLEAARDMLDFQDLIEGWDAENYASALRERFGS